MADMRQKISSCSVLSREWTNEANVADTPHENKNNEGYTLSDIDFNVQMYIDRTDISTFYRIDFVLIRMFSGTGWSRDKPF